MPERVAEPTSVVTTQYSAVSLEEKENRRLEEAPRINSSTGKTPKEINPSAESKQSVSKPDTYYKHEDDPNVNRSLSEK